MYQVESMRWISGAQLSRSRVGVVSVQTWVVVPFWRPARVRERVMVIWVVPVAVR